jgi:putative CocE/NonD family hydrolase
MTVASRAAARLGKLPPATSADVVVERDVEAKMADGAILLADRWYCPGLLDTSPVILIRSPYGRRQLGILGRLFAERNYQAVIQSVRGTFGSGGDFVPFRHERDDGLATLEWITEQPWFTGRLGTFGASYLGFTQWAVAAGRPDHLAAMAMQVTAANIRDAVVYPGGSFSLETGGVWVNQVEFQERGLARYLWAMTAGRRRLLRGYDTVPLMDADLASLGHRVAYYQEWLAHERRGDPWWDDVDYSKDMSRTPPSTHLGGWFDLFLPSQLADYRKLRDSGCDARLTVGPWTHTSLAAGAAGLRDALDHFDALLRSVPAHPGRGRVRIFVMGSERWVDLADWPPPAHPQRWHLQAGGGLTTVAPPDGGGSDRWRYDPGAPTPGLAGATLDPVRAGSRVQYRREERSDVVVYSTCCLRGDVTVAGPVECEMWVRSSTAYFDVFVRLCDVDGSGRSRNVSDGILRVDPATNPPDAEGTTRVSVRMWPTAHTFKAAHRIRLQVSSGAHPLYARNPGSGERLATAATFVVSDQEVLHDAAHPSAVILPVSPI